MTVDLIEALFLDFVVVVALICWLCSLLDGLCSMVFPLSIACRGNIKHANITTAIKYPAVQGARRFLEQRFMKTYLNSSSGPLLYPVCWQNIPH